jgi:hypothetical protein
MNIALTIQRAEMLAAFKTLRKLCRPSPSEEAVLSYDGACLHIELGGMAMTPAATGTWNGQARVPGSFILGLAKLPPSGDPVHIRVEQGRLHVGSTSVGCVWQAAWSKQIELPVNPSTTDLLTLRFNYTDGEIAASGLKQVLSEAEARLSGKLELAVQHLTEYDVTIQDMRGFLDRHLRQRLGKQ